VIVALAFLAVSLPDTAAWDSILKKFVLENGTVRYAALKQDAAALNRFVAQVGEVSPHSHASIFPTREARLAYWLNAYNALVFSAIVNDYPDQRDRLNSAWGKITFFYRLKFRVGGKLRSLDDIEKNTIRGEFKDARVHFAIFSGSAACPWLSRDAYTGGNVEAMLQRESLRYMAQQRNIKPDKSKRELTASEIFKWMREDFGKTDEEVIRFIGKFRADAADFTGGGWKLKYFPYDWSLNEAK
jgi:hypothetical protein